MGSFRICPSFVECKLYIQVVLKFCDGGCWWQFPDGSFMNQRNMRRWVVIVAFYYAILDGVKQDAIEDMTGEPTSWSDIALITSVPSPTYTRPRSHVRQAQPDLPAVPARRT